MPKIKKWWTVHIFITEWICINNKYEEINNQNYVKKPEQLKQGAHIKEREYNKFFVTQ